MRRDQRGETTLAPVLLAGFLVLTILVVVSAVAAFAQVTGGGYGDGSSIGGQIIAPGSGGGGSGSATGGSGSGGGGGPVATCTANGVTGPIRYSAVSAAQSEALSTPGPMVAELFPGNSRLNGYGGTPEAPGTWWAKSCGDQQQGYVWAPAGVPPDAVASPPAPPSAAEIRDRTPLPDPAFSVLPAVGLAGARQEAVTGLWDENGGAVRTVNLTLRGYTVVVRSTPTRWEWDLGGGGRNPNPNFVTTRPGTRDNPAVRYTYEEHGNYTVSVRVTWSGSYTFSGNGVAAQTVALAPATRQASQDYGVDAVQPVLERLLSP